MSGPNFTSRGNGESPPTARSNSFSQQSHASNDSQTAADFIRDQELLEADAREVLPYSIETCAKLLGPLRQNIFACLTCNPPPQQPQDAWTPAGVCYACSVQCHGEHDLVEIFQKRNFTCDCGTTRIPSTNPCALQINEETNRKGGVHSQEPDANNRYNQNFRNRFCGCECDYDPFKQKGTMFQCLGLGDCETGGCGEDWYHPGCVVGMGPRWYENMGVKRQQPIDRSEKTNELPTIAEGHDDSLNGMATMHETADADDDPPMPPGFPNEDDFDGFLCYKCVSSNPWIKPYVGMSGFLCAPFNDQTATSNNEVDGPNPRKRKTEQGAEDGDSLIKRLKHGYEGSETSNTKPSGEKVSPCTGEHVGDQRKACKLACLPSPPTEPCSLFFTEDFRDRLCRCSDCFPLISRHPQLLEIEVYEPPLSEDGSASQHGGSTQGSLLERGESALRNVDRVRAIEGVMAYNHLKAQLKPFFQQFASSGQAVSAEDIKAYFAKLRGDEQVFREDGQSADGSRKDEDGFARREQSGY